MGSAWNYKKLMVGTESVTEPPPDSNRRAAIFLLHAIPAKFTRPASWQGTNSLRREKTPFTASKHETILSKL